MYIGNESARDDLRKNILHYVPLGVLSGAFN